MTSRGQDKTDISRHQAWLAMLAITLLGMALRSFHLGFHRLWYDETFTAWTVAQTLWDVVWISLQDVVHPPLYYVLLTGWTRLAGNSEFALRTLSAGVSLLGVPLLYQLGWRGWNRRVGLTAAFLWACVPYAIWYAQEARMYALLTVVGLAATLCLARALPRGSHKWLVANAVLNLVGLYVHYFYLFLLLSQYLYLMLTLRRHRKAFWRWFVVNGVAALLYLPWLLAILQQGMQNAQIGWIAPLSLQSVWQAIWELSAGKGRPLTIWAAVSLVVLTIGLVAEALAARGRQRPPIPGRSPVPALQWTLLLAPLLLVGMISLRRPLFYPRFLQIVLPSYLLLASAGLLWLVRPRFVTVLVGVLALSWILAYPPMYEMQARHDHDWKAAMDYLSAAVDPDDIVAFRGGQGFHGYWYYYDGPPTDALTLSPFETIEDMSGQSAGAPHIWLVLWDTARNCEIPAQFVPGPGDWLGIVDTHCSPEILIVAFSGQGQQP